MSSCPLSILFDSFATRSLISNPSQLHYLLDTEEGWASFCAFKRIFKQYPDTFLKREHDRRNRCEENGVAYVPPKITDSADATKERIKKLNRAIKSAKQRVRRKEMTEKDRKELSAKRSAARMEKISRESEGDKKQRLKRGRLEEEPGGPQI
jgi:chromatin segregation and condensation protein Rec8/ScpA/Scc1 (kleisin family)